MAGFLPSGNPQDYSLTNITELIKNLVTLALDLAGIVAVIYIVLGAFQYFTAFGSEEKATAGKNTITWAITGLVLIIVAQLIVSTVFGFVAEAPPSLTPYVP